MKFEVGTPVISDFRSQFVCEISTMWGDGDGFEVLELPLKEHELAEFESDISKCIAKNRWFTPEDATNFVDKYFILHLDRGEYCESSDGEAFTRTLEWPNNPNGGYYNCYDGHTYYYYDAYSVKYNVIVTKTDSEDGEADEAKEV